MAQAISSAQRMVPADKVSADIQRLGKLLLDNTENKRLLAHQAAARAIVDILDPGTMTAELTEACWLLLKYCRQNSARCQAELIRREAEASEIVKSRSAA